MNYDSYANNVPLHIYPFAFLTKGLNEIVGFHTKTTLLGVLITQRYGILPPPKLKTPAALFPPKQAAHLYMSVGLKGCP